MRHVLGDTLRGLGADEDGVAELLLAVTEACTNVLKHGGPGRSYEIVASVGRGGCLVQVLNTGRELRPGDIPWVRWPVWLVPSGIRVGRRTVRPLSPARARRRHERGDRDEVMALLADDVTVTSDGGGKAAVISRVLRGPRGVARFQCGIARMFAGRMDHRIAWINGMPGILRYVDGSLDSATSVLTDGAHILDLYIVRNPDKLRLIELRAP